MTDHLLREYVNLLVEKIRTKKGQKGLMGEKFNLNKFKTFDNIHVMLEYAKKFLGILGTGSSRQAFTLSSKYVLKIALNDKGLSQNEAELDVFTNPTSKKVVAKIFGTDPEYRWLISEGVKPLSDESEFENLTGVPWKAFDVEVLASYIKGVKKLEKNTPDFFKAVIITAQNNSLMPGDLAEISHWGKTADGRCVLLDSGFTREVWKSHYSKSSNPVDPKTAASGDLTKNHEPGKGTAGKPQRDDGLSHEDLGTAKTAAAPDPLAKTSAAKTAQKRPQRPQEVEKDTDKTKR